MAIYFNSSKRIFTIQTKHTTYQFQADAYGFLLHLYYGPKVEDEMDYILTFADRGFSGNPNDVGADRTYSMDALPQEFPCMGTGDYRSIALAVRDSNGAYSCDLRYEGYRILEGKYALEGLPAVYADPGEAWTLEVYLRDPVTGLKAVLLYGVLPELDIITRSVRVKNEGSEEICIEKISSACLDFLSGDYDLITFYGRHAMERNMQRVPVEHGVQMIQSRRGASSHQYNPAMILAERNACEEFGTCYGMVFVYSGNFRGEVEKDQFNQTRAVLGLSREMFHYPLLPGEAFTAPEVILTCSGQGLQELSHQYHRCIRKHLCRGKYRDQVRPVLVNSWEAAYFHFDCHTILKLAEEAAALGMEMVVLDDGWFGRRDDDNSGLGDWKVNEEKLGCTLGELAQKINEKGLKFGLWIEPEMVSEDSDLYRAHPDWAMSIPGRKPVRARNQLVLDFSREDVRAEVFGQICRVLDSANIEYIKWDMSRSLFDVYSPCVKDQGTVLHKYILGVYDFLEKLMARYPDILIEGCSGGGGRFDAGMLYYTPQIWCSDNTDAIDRLSIQYGTSFVYPSSTVGAHVSAVPNHQTGRITSLRTRGVVAMAGNFGYELDLGKLAEEEKEIVKEQIRCFHQYAPLVQQGDYYRLTDPGKDEAAAWMFVSEDQREALVNIVRLANHGNMTAVYVRLKGLKPEALYEDTDCGKLTRGSALMKAGIPLPLANMDYQSYQIHLVLRQD